MNLLYMESILCWQTEEITEEETERSPRRSQRCLGTKRSRIPYWRNVPTLCFINLYVNSFLYAMFIFLYWYMFIVSFHHVTVHDFRSIAFVYILWHIIMCILTSWEGFTQHFAWIKSCTVRFNKDKVNVWASTLYFSILWIPDKQLRSITVRFRLYLSVFLTCLGLLSPYCLVFPDHIRSLYLHCFSDSSKKTMKQYQVVKKNTKVHHW